MLCVVICRNSLRIYAQRVVCMAVYDTAPLCSNSRTTNSQVGPFSTHCLLCIYVCTKSCKCVAAIHFPSLNKDETVEENPLGDVVPHVITHTTIKI